VGGSLLQQADGDRTSAVARPGLFSSLMLSALVIARGRGLDISALHCVTAMRLVIEAFPVR